MARPYIYLDYNATTPIDGRVRDAMLPYFGARYANPNSPHLFGSAVREDIGEATESLAATIGGDPNNIVYTSGATEAINLAVKGLLPSDKRHIVTISTEHKAVLDTCGFLESMGYRVSYLPVDPLGGVDLAQLSGAITEQTLMVCAMLANNETGVMLPVKEIGRIVHKRKTLLLCDATQAMGKIPLDVNDLDIDFLVFSAHKFYGPKGMGGLYLSKRAKKLLRPQIHGGGQQQGIRSGTLNVPGIIGMAKAATIAVSEMDAERSRIGKLRDMLEAELLAIPDTYRNGPALGRLYNTTNICFRGVPSEQLIMALGVISVSSGSACSATINRPSHVLRAMGLNDADGLSALRFSLGRFTTEEEIKTTIEAVKRSVIRLRP